MGFINRVKKNIGLVRTNIGKLIKDEDSTRGKKKKQQDKPKYPEPSPQDKKDYPWGRTQIGNKGTKAEGAMAVMVDTPVSSSWCQSVGYAYYLGNTHFFVRFYVNKDRNRNVTIVYKGIDNPVKMYYDMIGSSSKGRFVWAELYHQFHYDVMGALPVKKQS